MLLQSWLSSLFPANFRIRLSVPKSRRFSRRRKGFAPLVGIESLEDRVLLSGATLSIGDASVIEGDAGTTVLSFTVTLSNAVDVDVSVDYVTQDGTATTADNDYVGVTTPATLTILAGDTTGQIDITVNGDTAIEPDETMHVVLSNLQAGGRDVSLASSGQTTFSPAIVQNVGTTSNTRNVEIVGNLAYVADSANGVKILDVSDPTSPTLIGTYDTNGVTNSVRVHGNWAYVADGPGGLVILDVTNPASPTLVGSLDQTGDNLRDVHVVGNHVYAADIGAVGIGLLRIYDVSDPTAPVQIGSYSSATTDQAHVVQVVGNLAYVADDRSGVYILDVTDPTDPTLVSTIESDWPAIDLQVVGDRVYVANGGGGLLILDVSNPSSPSVVSQTLLAGFANGVQVRGDYAYVGRQETFRIVDISNPASPVIVGTVSTPGIAAYLAVADDFAYVADGSSGLQIIDLNSRTTATGTIINDDPAASTATISGTVFVDANGNGLFDGGTETGIDGVTIELLDSEGVLLQTVLTSMGGVYAFTVDDAFGTYRIRKIQPTGVDGGAAILGDANGNAITGEAADGSVISANEMELILDGLDASDYDFTEVGQAVQSGDTAAIGFWQNKNGQELIKQGGSALVAWLNDNFGNIFGSTFTDGSGGDNADEVATFYKNEIFNQKLLGTSKVDAQFMALALATFFTSSNLSGSSVAAGYGFNVTDTGIGTKVVNVGASGAAFNVDDNTNMTIMALLLATNNMTGTDNGLNNGTTDTGDGGYTYIYDANGDGILDEAEKTMRDLANTLYSAINETGHI
jgi:hypothetical protein